MGGIVAAGAAGAAVLAAGVYLGVALYGADQITRRPRRAQEHDPEAIGASWESVAFPSRDGLKLRGWWFPVPNAQRALILVHGYGAHRIDAAWGSDAIARHFLTRGCSVLLFDLRGHGASDHGRLTFGVGERFDVLGALDFVRGRGFPPARMALVGVSYGAAAALIAAPELPELAAVVADSAFAEAWPVIAAKMRQVAPLLAWLHPDPAICALTRLLYGVDLRRARPVDAAARLHGVPVLLIHGAADTYIPPRHARRLQAALPGAHLWLVPGAEHAQTYLADPDGWLTRVEAFLEASFAARSLGEHANH